ncbi:NAD(P)H-hydrate dehydratase [Halocynthiibacter sp.]|uniref:NAD(P)H-hydrate dehydratase n=1 Tax=Halocynthiibacter sp. TaxID=1979210 RepID=UPI003C4E2747
MTELLTAAQMRAIEQAAIERGDVTGLELMERAGAGVVEAIYDEWPEFGDAGRGASPSRSPEYLGQDEKQIGLRAVVLCGPGNNGGDGFVVARLLHQRGWAVEVFLYGDPDKLPPDARVNYERWCELGGVLPMSARQPFYADLYIDAGFGIGLSREMPDDLYWALTVAHQSRASGSGQSKVVAIDTPSSLCADSGRYLGRCYQDPYHLTVTFQSLKLGHVIGDGPQACGKIRIVDIGLGEVVTQYPVEMADCSGCFWRVDKTSAAHKFSHGHALILSGGPAQTGAARLAARGTLRIGSGLVTLGVPPAAQQEVACQVTAIMLKRVRDAAAFAGVLDDKRINALCLGPAFGLGEREAELLDVALQSGRNCVLDADALTLLARDKALFDKLHSNCVLTPHAGEFARLFPDIAEKLDAPATTGPAYSKVDATREAAKQAGCVVLFKGKDTVISAPDGRATVNAAVYDRAAPWLATAGSGDVLAGFITGLMARGFSPFEAAETGAWLHVECALKFGPGLIAEDIPEQLPQVFRTMAQGQT